MSSTAGQAEDTRAALRSVSRAGILAASSSRPRRKRTGGRIRSLVRIDRGVASGVRSATTAALVTGPQVAITRLADNAVGGHPATAEQVARHRQVALAANGAAILTGMLAQRAVIHGLPRNSASDALRFLARQLAIGGAAGAIVVATDAALGQGAPALKDHKRVALTVGGALVLAQSLAMRQAGRFVSLDPGPTEVDMPVIGLGGIQTVKVPISSGRLVR
jgi:hypothetical protein